MLVKPMATIALRCPSCGRMDYHEVNLFSFNGKQGLKCTCTCGRGKVSLYRKKRRIWMEISCPLCEETHVSSLSVSEFWASQPRSLYCSNTEVEVGFMGADQDVRTIVHQHQARVDAAMAEAGFYELFDEPDVMYEVLHHLRGWAEGGHLLCPCGNRKIEMDIYPDRLELRCQECGRKSTLSAKSWYDVEALRSMEPLESNERGRRLFPDK